MNMIHTSLFLEPAVIPVLLGPLQVLLVALPALLMALLSILGAVAKPRKALSLLRLLWKQKLPVVIIIILLVAGRYAWRELILPARSASGAATSFSRGMDWPMFRGGIGRTGVVAGAPGPIAPSVNWSFKQKNEAYLSSAAVSGDRVYMSSAGMGIFNRRGNIYCFEKTTGELLWKTAPSGYLPTFSSPSISGNYLVCGEGLHVSKDSRVVAMDISSEEGPVPAWTFRSSSHVECTPVIVEGRVYVGAGDDGYYCLELEPDSKGQPVVVWHLEGADYPDAETSLLVHDGIVYAGLGVGGEALCVLDAATGDEIKRMPTGYPVFSPPSIHKGRLYIGMGNGNYIYSASEVRANKLRELQRQGASDQVQRNMADRLSDGGEVWCLDLETLKTLWVYKCRSTVLGSIATVDDGVYFATRDGQVNHVSHNGDLLASTDLAAITLSSPAATADHVYLMTANGHLYAMSAGSLKMEWDIRIGSGKVCVSSPTVDNGRIYVGTGKDGFICAGTMEKKETSPSWQGPLGGQGKTGNSSLQRVPDLGDFHWQYPADQEGNNDLRIVVAPAASLDDKLYVPLAVGQTGLACLNSGMSGYQTPVPLWLYQTGNGVLRSPVADRTNVFITDTGEGGMKGHLHCLAVDDGTLVWKKSLEPEASGFVALMKDMVLVQDGVDKVSAYSLKGEQLWSRLPGRLSFPPSLHNSMVLLSVDNGNALVLMDGPTGKQLWRLALDHAAMTSPVIRENEILVGTSRGLEYRSLLDGSKIVIVDVGPGGCKGNITLADDSIFCADVHGKRLIEIHNRLVVASYANAHADINPVISGDGRVIYMTDKGLMAAGYSGEDKAPVLWSDCAWLGASSSPMIMHGNSIFMGTVGWGLVCIGGEE